MRRPARSAALLLTLLAHLGLLWLLLQPRPGTPRAVAPQQRLLVQLIAEPRPMAAPALPPRSVPAPRPEARATSKPLQVPPALAITATLPAALPAEAPASAALPEPAASRPWLDPEKTRQAIRQAAAQPSLREQAALASEAPRRLTAGERFGQEVQQAATGDCLKGEFLGGGMGLLSAPFWALAEARGKCRR